MKCSMCDKESETVTNQCEFCKDCIEKNPAIKKAFEENEEMEKEVLRALL